MPPLPRLRGRLYRLSAILHLLIARCSWNRTKMCAYVAGKFLACVAQTAALLCWFVRPWLAGAFDSAIWCEAGCVVAGVQYGTWALLTSAWRQQVGPTSPISLVLNVLYLEIPISDDEVPNIKISPFFVLYAILLTNLPSKIVCKNLFLGGSYSSVNLISEFAKLRCNNPKNQS